MQQTHLPQKQEIQQGPLVRAFMHPVVQKIWKALGLQKDAWSEDTSMIIGGLFSGSKVSNETEIFRKHEKKIYKELVKELRNLDKHRFRSPADRATFPQRSFPLTHQKIEVILEKSKFIAPEWPWSIDPSKIEEWIRVFHTFGDDYRLEVRGLQMSLGFDSES